MAFIENREAGNALSRAVGTDRPQLRLADPQARTAAAAPAMAVHALACPELEPRTTACQARQVERARRRYDRSARVRRILDVVMAGGALMALLPVMAVIAAGVKFTSRGGAVFRQTRIGRSGESFECLKFRTMVADADRRLADLLTADADARAAFEQDFKLATDPRITRIGRFLRRTSLDEIPQLINVLRGEMSIVGPRPVVPEELRRYGNLAQVVLQVRPGMTGPWQVSGRNAVPYAERIQIDVDYALNHRLVSDLGIIAKTVRCVLRPRFGEAR